MDAEVSAAASGATDVKGASVAEGSAGRTIGAAGAVHEKAALRSCGGASIGSCGYAVNAALRLLPRGPYDLVITDINMPDINGLELVSFLKNHPTYRTIPIMVISTESSDADRKRASALGAEEYLVKPFQSGELVDKLRRILRVA